MEVDESPEAIASLIADSRKRSHDLFLRNYGNRLQDDTESQKIKLAIKVNAEYAKVRHMAPPAKRVATEKARASAAQAPNVVPLSTEEPEIVVAGGHPVPS